MSVKEVLKKIRETDARLAEARRALAAAEQRQATLEDDLAALLAEGREPSEKELAQAGAIAVETAARQRALARIEQERAKLIDALIDARVRELREEAQRAEREVAKMEDEAFQHLQKAGAALGLRSCPPLALLLRAAPLVPANPRDVDGPVDRFWSIDNSRWAELSAKARELRNRAETFLHHPIHRQQEIARLLGEEVTQNA
jgi:DNA repair exonuclease SbcCD ATPase subunit